MSIYIDNCWAEQQKGFPKAKESLAKASDDDLLADYRQGMKDVFGAMFGHNAAIRQDLIADELLRRGITEIPNMLGPIPVRTGNRKFASDQATARVMRRS